jgi:hypothetical protein
MKNYKLSDLKTSIDGLMNEIEIEVMHTVCDHEYDPQTLKNEKLEATRREIRAKIYKLFLDAAAMHGIEEEK